MPHFRHIADAARATEDRFMAAHFSLLLRSAIYFHAIGRQRRRCRCRALLPLDYLLPPSIRSFRARRDKSDAPIIAYKRRLPTMACQDFAYRVADKPLAKLRHARFDELALGWPRRRWGIRY